MRKLVLTGQTTDCGYAVAVRFRQSSTDPTWRGIARAVEKANADDTSSTSGSATARRAARTRADADGATQPTAPAAAAASTSTRTPPAGGVSAGESMAVSLREARRVWVGSGWGGASSIR